MQTVASIPPKRSNFAVSLLLLLSLTGVALASLAVWSQPRMADDWNLAWTIAHYGSVANFVIESYFNWSGRLLPFLVAGLAVSSEAGWTIFKLSIIPCFLVLSASAYYVATGVPPWSGKAEARRWLFAAAILWLGLPVVSDTVVQTTGACGYLLPATAGMVFLCLMRRGFDRATAVETWTGGWVMRIALFAAGVATGTCNEQLFAGVAVVLTGWGWLLWRKERLAHVPAEAWWGAVGLLLGTFILVAAPGNYVRLGSEGWSAGGIGSMLLRYVMYLGGAYFGLGTGDTGRALWLGLAVIALSGHFEFKSDRTKQAAVLAAASLATLLPMLPLVNVASPRTTFFASILLIMAAISAFPRKGAVGDSRPADWVVAYSLAILVMIDGLAGWAANRSLASEVRARETIMRKAAAEGRSEAVVPYLATVPSRLTFMLDPRHDAGFLPKLARHHGLASARYDETPGAPRPYTLNALKQFKTGL